MGGMSKHSDIDGSEASIFGEQTTEVKDKWARSLETFRNRYGFLPPLENQPSEQTLSLIAKLHGRKSAEFPLVESLTIQKGGALMSNPLELKGRLS